MHDAMTAAAGIATAIIGLAIVAVLVSKNANTSSVVSSAGTAFGGIIGSAVSPVSGASSFGSLGSAFNPAFTGVFG